MEQLILQFLITAIQQKKRALTICTENPVIQENIQMEQFIPLKCFRKKGRTLWGISFLPLLPERTKFSEPFVWISSARQPGFL